MDTRRTRFLLGRRTCLDEGRIITNADKFDIHAIAKQFKGPFRSRLRTVSNEVEPDLRQHPMSIIGMQRLATPVTDKMRISR
jgi:hypothetical protein